MCHKYEQASGTMVQTDNNEVRQRIDLPKFKCMVHDVTNNLLMSTWVLEVVMAAPDFITTVGQVFLSMSIEHANMQQSSKELAWDTPKWESSDFVDRPLTLHTGSFFREGIKTVTKYIVDYQWMNSELQNILFALLYFLCVNRSLWDMRCRWLVGWVIKRGVLSSLICFLFMRGKIAIGTFYACRRTCS